MDILQTIGITAPPPSDPKRFEDQKVITQQTSLVRTQLRSLLSSVDFATQVATVAGLPTSGLESLQKDIAATASSVTLSPADLEKKRAEYEAIFEKTRGEQEAAIRAAEVTKLRAVLEKIKKRDAEIAADSGLSAETKARSKKLLEDAEYALKVATGAAPAAKEGFQTTPAAVTTVAPPAPVALSAAELERQYTVLDLDVAGELEKVFDWRRMLKRTFYNAANYIMYTLLVIGALLGGIFCSNLYAMEHFWAIRLYYFVYGAAFFPLVILYSIFKPTYIYSYIFPAYEQAGGSTVASEPSIASSEPTEAAPPVKQTVASAAPQAAKAAAAKARAAAAGVLGKLPKFFGGGDDGGDDTLETRPTEGVDTRAPADQGFFSFQRLDPIAAKVKLGSSQGTVRIISIAYSLISAGFSVMYFGWGALFGGV